MGAYLNSSTSTIASATSQTVAQPIVTLISPPNRWDIRADALSRSPSFPWTGELRSKEYGSINSTRAGNIMKEVEIPPSRRISDEDMNVLAEHIDSDSPLEANNISNPRLFSLLRASAPKALDFPAIHFEARGLLKSRFASDPHNLLSQELWQDVEVALSLARQHDVGSIQPGLFYTFITTSHFEPDPSTNQPFTNKKLTLEDLAHCSALQNSLLELFAPTLFQAPPAGHMECTDALAAAWLTDVVPATFNSNNDEGATGGAQKEIVDLGRPLETLTTLEKMDWASKGICEECIRGKKEEWKAERETIWAKLSQWITDADKSRQ